MQTSDLITQIQNLAAEHDALQADAAHWRELLTLTAELGYGPRLTPAQIAELLPNVHGILAIVAATQEVVPAPSAGSKMPRRKITAEDERVITARRAAGLAPEQIASDLGLSLNAVVAYLERD